ncbi:MAG: hypothetical protein U9Q68_11080 [Euryarchaeota archaeon]|nr:hypothetical protein [Euryarchaeota archaeon]
MPAFGGTVARISEAEIQNVYIRMHRFHPSQVLTPEGFCLLGGWGVVDVMQACGGVS